MKTKDSLGDRMKSFYEDRCAPSLLRRAYTVFRVDGRAFHTFTRGLKRPYDEELAADMDATAAELCAGIMGAKLAYVQSDEISVVVTDFDDLRTQAWFDYGVQKMCSVSASMATRAFNQRRQDRQPGSRWAEFDSRVFQLPNLTEVENYLIWRQQDATRNSISMAAQSMIPHKELLGVSSSGKMDAMHARGVNWNNYDPGFKRGRAVVKVVADNGRSKWTSIEVPILTVDRGFVRGHVPDRDTTVVQPGVDNAHALEARTSGGQ